MTNANAVSRTARWLTIVVVAAWVALVAMRIVGPSDLYDKEQPRTIAYTADMLVNGHWTLPRDTYGIPATKPPLFNWLTAPFVAAFGFQEWALKMPAVLASAAVVLLIVLGARQVRNTEWWPELVGPLAALMYLACFMTAKLLYLARPDMLLTAFLMGAWVTGTGMVKDQRPRFGLQAAFWLCTLGAAMTKGPSALIAMLYVVLAARWIAAPGGFVATLKRTGWWWGLPLLLAVSALYVVVAQRQDPEAFRELILQKEVAGHIAGPLQFAKTIFNGPFYVFARFLPWSLLVIAAMCIIPPRRWMRHSLGPAILWLLLFLAGMSFVSTKRPDRYAPLFPVMALMAAWGALALTSRLPQFRPTTLRLAAIPLGIVAIVIVNNQFFSDAVNTHYGERLKTFAREVRAMTMGEPILFEDGLATPIQTLLGHNQPPAPAAEYLQRSRWLICFPKTDEAPGIVSEPLPLIDSANRKRQEGRLALYRLTTPPENFRAPLDPEDRFNQYVPARTAQTSRTSTSPSKPNDDDKEKRQSERH